jgi:hypothetical protein
MKDIGKTREVNFGAKSLCKNKLMEFDVPPFLRRRRRRMMMMRMMMMMMMMTMTVVL